MFRGDTESGGESEPLNISEDLRADYRLDDQEDAASSVSLSELPELATTETESEPDILSSDSGRSDTWVFTGGIVNGVRRVDECDVESGVATVTGPELVVIDGFTSDGVVDVSTSDLDNQIEIRVPVSTTTDEGMESEGSWSENIEDEVADWREYIDDEIVVNCERYDLNGIRGEIQDDANSSEESIFISHTSHGSPSIAGIQGQDQDEERIISNLTSHGRRSIAGIQRGGMYSNEERMISSNTSHGRLSIAGIQRGGMGSAEVECTSTSHGRLSIAEILGGFEADQFLGDHSSQSEDDSNITTHGRLSIARIQGGGLGDLMDVVESVGDVSVVSSDGEDATYDVEVAVGINEACVMTTGRQPTLRVRDNTCDGDLGGGPQLFLEQNTSVPCGNDDDERVLKSEEGQSRGLEDQEEDVANVHAKGLIGEKGMKMDPDL